MIEDWYLFLPNLSDFFLKCSRTPCGRRVREFCLPGPHSLSAFLRPAKSWAATGYFKKIAHLGFTYLFGCKKQNRRNNAQSPVIESYIPPRPGLHHKKPHVTG